MHGSGKEDKTWVFIPRTEKVSPSGFGVCENDGGKPAELVLRGADWAGFRWGGDFGHALDTGEEIQHGQGIDAREVADGERQHNRADAEATFPDAGRAHSATIFDVVTFALVVDTHRRSPSGRTISPIPSPSTE